MIFFLLKNYLEYVINLIGVSSDETDIKCRKNSFRNIDCWFLTLLYFPPTPSNENDYLSPQMLNLSRSKRYITSSSWLSWRCFTQKELNFLNLTAKLIISVAGGEMRVQLFLLESHRTFHTCYNYMCRIFFLFVSEIQIISNRTKLFFFLDNEKYVAQV